MYGIILIAALSLGNADGQRQCTPQTCSQNDHCNISTRCNSSHCCISHRHPMRRAVHIIHHFRHFRIHRCCR